ncbi:hypothetical protein SAMN04489761_2638 [Tenacibaculum sp. MAR_2009_124]|uniref:hypothetical protein n=1 Tax=Tenacibaculum sp. MAR_2009_124 TaxID=1250059 RepID=UPI000895864B|nr:hypothetical protein [Tenacibaculum sp. MAR_2009_124]SEC30839.1 hypothetical protein SAMN04489761_2638 [Tenacibaculum sp. MAR_2009_124]
MSRKLHLTTRKTHRYLGLFIGVQFLFWTVGGLYFSWNNMKDVHGKTLLDKSEKSFSFKVNESLASCLDSLENQTGFKSSQIEGVVFGADSLLRVSSGANSCLITLSEGNYQLRNQLSEKEIVAFVESRLYNPIPISNIAFIENDLSNHHEYRGKQLPVYAVRLKHETNTKVYVDPRFAKITSVRNDNWRRFDFLWMLHVMDFETRDHITNWVLRVFSIVGLLTICSGFYLFYLSSPTIRKIKKKLKE